MRSGPPATGFLELPGGRKVAYAVNGSGPPLVCTAWWVSHVESDWGQAELRGFFERLGEIATVVRYDRPGVGLSDRAAGIGSFDDEVAVIDALVGALGFDRISLLGISTGGPLALAWAARDPSRVERLVLFGAFATGRLIAPPELQEALARLVRAHWGAGARALADVFVADATPAQRDAFTHLQQISADAATAERLLRLTYEVDVAGVLAGIAAPVLVVHRRGDRAIPHDCGRALAAGIPGARLVTLEGRMHPPWWGGDAIEPILDFLGGRDVRAPARGACQLDEANRCLRRDGQEVPLTPLELGVLGHLVRHPDQVVSRDQLIEAVWRQRVAGSNVVDAVVRTLRKKLEDWSPSVETVVGHGYRFRGWRRGSTSSQGSMR